MKVRTPCLSFIVAAIFFALPASFRAGESAVGTYLWFPGPGGPKSEQDCIDLVDRVKPSKEKAENSIWGSVPDEGRVEDSFYLMVSESRMEPTYAAEGDYDFGNVSLGKTECGETKFTLTPDHHPDTRINGTFIAKLGSNCCHSARNSTKERHNRPNNLFLSLRRWSRDLTTKPAGIAGDPATPEAGKSLVAARTRPPDVQERLPHGTNVIGL
jgi:hypothetical protein